MPCLSYPQARLWGAYHLCGNFGQILRQQWCTFFSHRKQEWDLVIQLKKLVLVVKAGPITFCPKIFHRDEPFHLNSAGITLFSVEMVSAQNPMLDFSIVLLTDQNPNFNRVDVIE